MQSASQLPLGAWDCHVHCFDPEHHPFKSSRAYTPKPATIDDLSQNLHADRIMLVQATIEAGFQGLLDNLTNARKEYPSKVFRGTIFADTHRDRSLERVPMATFDALHEAGVRSIRIHGSYGGAGNDLEWIRDQFRGVAGLYPIQKYGWSISAQLPLASWAALRKFLCRDPSLEQVVILADHNGSAKPSDIGTPDFDDFLGLLEQGKLYVKLGALHRRSPLDIHKMRPVVEIYARNAPKSIVWGSDWPHCDTSASGLIPADPLRGVDTRYELQTLRDWLSEDQWNAMLILNPQRLFDN